MSCSSKLALGWMTKGQGAGVQVSIGSRILTFPYRPGQENMALYIHFPHMPSWCSA
jgi:hypothetical protein